MSKNNVANTTDAGSKNTTLVNQKETNKISSKIKMTKEEFIENTKSFNKFYFIIFIICGIVSLVGLLTVIIGFYLSDDVKLIMSITGVVLLAGGFITFYVINTIKKIKYNNLIVKYELDKVITPENTETK
ncbi:hypothetical protein [Spiroplasma endosymbiont of Amphibalanus improvisus]|uniref:hypothetical protein n=1 Tax=Spiroplasma endosymbiont of Amphibalanus improvisus TaxID=3066327 RepID=UPI00313B1651